MENPNINELLLKALADGHKAVTQNLFDDVARLQDSVEDHERRLQSDRILIDETLNVIRKETETRMTEIDDLKQSIELRKAHEAQVYDDMACVYEFIRATARTVGFSTIAIAHKYLAPEEGEQ